MHSQHEYQLTDLHQLGCNLKKTNLDSRLPHDRPDSRPGSLEADGAKKKAPVVTGA
jgi:hypothetical protein